jgi:isoleucyl-tRNA synthetase
VNELISKIQTMRKENGYEVTDRIRVTLAGNEKLAAIMQRNEDEIGRVVLADSFTYADGAEGKSWHINDEKATLLLERV